MKNKIIIAAVIVLAITAGAILLIQNYLSNQRVIGGDRSAEGCLIAAGYSFDAQVGACVRSFELTADIKRAAQMAVDKVGKSYALTVASFNSYEEPGTYDITLEKGLEREKVTVYIKNWEITSKPNSFQSAAEEIQFILANKYNKPLSDVKVTVTKQIQGFASGSVLFGQGGPGEGGMWLAVLGNGWQVVWDGNGNVDCNKMRQDYGIPDDILVPNFCQSQESAVEEAVRVYVATKAGINKSSVTIVSITPKNWTDSCLGLGGPAESCLAASTPGYEVTVKVNSVEQIYRTNADGSVIRK